MSDVYKKAGVDINKGNAFVHTIKPYVESTKIPGCLGGIGGFSGMFDLGENAYKHPVLVTATDGVGTKLAVANMCNKHDTIGIDLVAMCVNDLIATGATPLCFLDYYATSSLNSAVAADVVKGIAQGCKQANCALTGGETAEMPGMYKGGDYDVAGFAVGVVEYDAIIDGKQNVSSGDVIIGLHSSGLHSNGYSLVRKLCFEDDNFEIHDFIHILGGMLGDVLLTPTVIYTQLVLDVLNTFGRDVTAVVHNTGGGFCDNVARVLPIGCNAVIDCGCWNAPNIFSFIQDIGAISDEEMHQVFNMGIGMMLIVRASQVYSVVEHIHNTYGTCYDIIGHVQSRDLADAVTLNF